MCCWNGEASQRPCQLGLGVWGEARLSLWCCKAGPQTQWLTQSCCLRVLEVTCQQWLSLGCRQGDDRAVIPARKQV